MILLLGFAFLAGLVTILAPCIWPLLPIVLSSSVTGKTHSRPLGITLGIMLSFAFFTLSISLLVSLFHLDPNILRLFAVVVLVFLGLSLIIPALSRLTETWVSRLAGKFGTTGKNQGSDFGSGFVTGLALGVVWTPCSGPILATIATLGAMGQVSFQVILVTLAYVTGVGIPLFLFAYGGQKVVGRTRFLSAYTGRVQQVFGVLMLLTALAIYTNYDKVVQLKLLDAFPSYSSLLTSFEKNSVVKEQLDILKRKKSTSTKTDTNGLFNENKQAPEFIGITNWLNLPAGRQALTIENLKGKVVLVDFWTYTCINCIRTLPHVTSWYNKYKDQGFVVIGVHTPEFEFEKNTGNVENAIKIYNIHYPVAQDNDYATWNNYDNQYWPAKYLIDTNGTIRKTHFGEGEYDQMEMAIQTLLKEAGKKVSNKLESMPDETPQMRFTPETYLGSKRMEYHYPERNISAGRKTLALEKNIAEDSFSLGGDWTISDEYSRAEEDGVLRSSFYADKVFLVMRPPKDKSAKIRVFLDGKAVNDTNAGADVVNGEVNITVDKLYNLIDLKGKPGRHILEIKFGNGVEVFAFTFG